ncbi:hypothetical protein CR492_18630 [Methylocella silvestris]|uniref:Uncharacterized protein n=1 Tax=Methylocella silvestris TaxID=199596 RepID=A0A2J7TCF6_METSI|nr:hypothetical protein CR492_18630 [Methylocella silvestris]
MNDRGIPLASQMESMRNVFDVDVAAFDSARTDLSEQFAIALFHPPHQRCGGDPGKVPLDYSRQPLAKTSCQADAILDAAAIMPRSRQCMPKRS